MSEPTASYKNHGFPPQIITARSGSIFVRSVRGAGDAYSLPGSLSHRFCNTKRVECEVVSVFSQPA